jgi:hypothetical protein
MQVDNTACAYPRLAFFGFGHSASSDGFRVIRGVEGITAGFTLGHNLAITTDFPVAGAGLGFTIEDILRNYSGENAEFGVGTAGALVFEIPPRARSVIKISICFYRHQPVTTGIESAYYYSKFFPDVSATVSFATRHFETYKAKATADNEVIRRSALNPHQKFMLAHAIRGYFNSTQLLAVGDKPVWVVNEGEYRLMNTLDLTVDQIFFEMSLNPWTVRNVLDMYSSRYSYYDDIRTAGGIVAPGGISFTHDMGIRNAFSRPGHSSYEKCGISGCFSHMSQEQLVNWILTAGIYYFQSEDDCWLRKQKRTFRDCLKSMLNRDNPDPSKRTGIMSFDSARTWPGSEITTYDSLDESLGQARKNVYLAVKGLSAYLYLTDILAILDMSAESAEAFGQAQLCSKTLLKNVQNGIFPAIIGQEKDMKIIPVVEGLAYCLFGPPCNYLRQEPFSDLVDAMRVHLKKVLVPGICMYEKAWKLSSTVDNTWLSKIYIAQFVARKILGMSPDPDADHAHAEWLLDPEGSFWCWSDQIINKKVKQSRYYPRGVTSALWLYENEPITSKGIRLKQLFSSIQIESI